MEFLRIILLVLIYGALMIFLGSMLLRGLRTGKMAHSDSERFIDQMRHPMLYWGLAALFSGIIMLGIIGLLRLFVSHATVTVVSGDIGKMNRESVTLLSNGKVEMGEAAPDSFSDDTNTSATQPEFVQLQGSVRRGETFERQVAPGLIFRLEPDPGAYGWFISVEGIDGTSGNYAGVVTSPYYGMNDLYIAGWHFRNANNTGPNESGQSNVNAPGTTREFRFVLNEADYKKESEILKMRPVPWERHGLSPQGKGTLTITNLKLGHLLQDRQAWIEEMDFTVTLQPNVLTLYNGSTDGEKIIAVYRALEKSFQTGSTDRLEWYEKGLLESMGQGENDPLMQKYRREGFPPQPSVRYSEPYGITVHDTNAVVWGSFIQDGFTIPTFQMFWMKKQKDGTWLIANHIISHEAFSPSEIEAFMLAWRTYRSEEMGFEVKYPKGWRAKECRQNTTGETFTVSFEKPILPGETSFGVIQFVVDQKPYPESLSFEQWRDENIPSEIEITPVIVGNVPAYRTEDTMFDRKRHRIFLLANKKIINITYDLSPEFDGIYKSILASFRVLSA
jgi:hypothetical protein